MNEPNADITQLLDDITGGRAELSEELLPLVYDELRRIAGQMMAQERADHTLQATELVHEAFLRLVGSEATWENRRHFYNAAARAMRRILVDSARRRQQDRHGGGQAKAELVEDVIPAPGGDDAQLIGLDSALERFQTLDPAAAEIVMLRYFSGLTIEEAAQACGMSPATVKREWESARAWLFRELKQG